MRRVLLVALFIMCEQGCALNVQVKPDTIKMYGIPDIHDHDLLCAIDRSAPNLQSCMTYAQFQMFLHSVRAN